MFVKSILGLVPAIDEIRSVIVKSAEIYPGLQACTHLGDDGHSTPAESFE